MEETKRTFADDEGEETMVAPRFDDEETVLARPVVPFEEVGDAPDGAPVAASMTVAPPPPLHSRTGGAPRRSLVAVLVLVSALVGSVLGVAGLYFYQKGKSADANETQEQQAEAPAAQPTTETASESPSRETVAPAAAAEPSTPAPAVVEPEVEADDDNADTARDKDSDDDDRRVAERRNASEDREPVVNTKRGKKGERVEEIRREARRAPRYDEDSRPPVRDEEASDRREARRVGIITYRPRRVRQRRDRDRDGSPDRLRRIFEGQP